MSHWGSASRLLAIALALAAGPVQAGDVCDYYRSHDAGLFKLFCGGGGGGGRKAAVAGAHSTFNDGFNMNGGALPTEPTSYGFEAIGSMLRESPSDFSPTFSIVKGYHRIGTGVSTAGNNTFYGNDVLQRTKSTPELTSFAPLEHPNGFVTNANIGAALGLIQARKGIDVKLGVSLRYNKTTNTVGGGPGLLVASPYFTVGIGVTREKVSNYLQPLYFVAGMVSARLLFLELEYNVLVVNGDLGLDPIHILTASMSIRRLMLTAAVRRLNYLNYGSVTQEYYAVQFLLGKSLAIGALYNFIPGATSAAFQYYL